MMGTDDEKNAKVLAQLECDRVKYECGKKNDD